MESSIASSFRHQKSASSHRFLGLFSGNAEPGPAVELDEHDVFWNDRGDFPDKRPQCSPDASANSMASRGSGGITGFRRQENFGILAALPDTLDNDHRSFLHRSVISSPSYSSSPSPSSSRMIPTIPKPQSPAPGEKLHQSAPLNVPVMPMVAGGRRRNLGAFYEFDNCGDEDGDDEMLPPHEIVARGLSRSPMTTFSVLEGKGRTLKGSDLRRVRNAVFQKTGFLD